MSIRSLFRPLVSAGFLLMGGSPFAEAAVPVTVYNQTARTLSVIQGCPGHGTPAGLLRDASSACGCLEPGAVAGGCPCPRPEATASQCCCLRPGASATYQLEGPEAKSPRQVIRVLPEGGVIRHQGLTIMAVDPVPPCPCSKPGTEPAARPLAGGGQTLRILDPSSCFMPGLLLPGQGLPDLPGSGFRPIGDEPPPDPEGSGAVPEPACPAESWCG